MESMMHFAHLEAFLLLPLWGAAGWLLPHAHLFKPLRLLVVLLLMLAWANPFIDRQTPGLDLWVMNDLSLSAEESVQPRMAEIERLLRESKGKHDELFFVDFADDAIRRDPVSAAVLDGRKDATRIGNMLQYTLSQLRPNRNRRLLLMSDGYGTDPLELAGDRLLREGVPLDLRLMQPAQRNDVRVVRVDAPLRVKPGEPFLVEAQLSGPVGESAEVIFLRDGVEMQKQMVTFVRGEVRLQWTARLMESGAVPFDVRVSAVDDAYIDNNQQRQWVEAAGMSHMLLLSAYADDPLATLLRAGGQEVMHLTEFTGLNDGSLSGVGLVWIHNVHAAEIPQSFLQALPFYVTEQGGGLVMTGGKAAFGSGGYFESPVDPLLPVSMELKEEDRKLAVAMGIVMDRSGSMSAGTMGGMTKMDLANAGAARAIELLGDMDAVTVFAVDTEAHEILPLSRVGNNRNQLTSMVRRVQSTGGGIYVFNGLEAAWKQLQNAPQGRRHVILFADAADSEQPEGVGELIKEMGAHNTTVSVIALGTPTDPDAPFLEQIAEDGQGRLFFNDDANTLPAVFAQETVSISRSAFLDEPTGIEARAGWPELAAMPMDWPTSVDGYNLSYLREGAAESLRSLDRYGAPILSHWQRGIGKVVAVSMPLGGPFSEQMRNWPQYGDFVRTLHRWSMRGEMPQGLALRMKRVGETLRVQLYADAVWQEKFARNPPRLVTRSHLDEAVQTHAWRRMQPGMVETDLPLLASERVQGAIQIGDEVLPFGPVNGTAGAEWEFDPEMRHQLQALSQQSGGQERVDLAGIWDSPRQQNFQGTRTYWLLAAMLLFLAEALWARLGGKLPSMELARTQRQQKTKAAPESKAEAPVVREAIASPPPRSAFRRAKDRRTR